MVRVTPISVAYTVLLSIAVFSFALPAAEYYTNPNIAATLNASYQNINGNFTSKIYSPTYNSIFVSSSGLKASGSLQQFTGLAFMFGEMFQVSSEAFQGIPMLSTMLSSLAQYSPLPDVSVAALLGLLFTGAAFLLGWFFIASWTKVEA